MTLGLHAKIKLSPQSVRTDRWIHDMANLFCRIKLELELRQALLREYA